jgi:hypothetical protein
MCLLIFVVPQIACQPDVRQALQDAAGFGQCLVTGIVIKDHNGVQLNHYG